MELREKRAHRGEAPASLEARAPRSRERRPERRSGSSPRAKRAACPQRRSPSRRGAGRAEVPPSPGEAYRSSPRLRRRRWGQRRLLARGGVGSVDPVGRLLRILEHAVRVSDHAGQAVDPALNVPTLSADQFGFRGRLPAPATRRWSASRPAMGVPSREERRPRRGVANLSCGPRGHRAPPPERARGEPGGGAVRSGQLRKAGGEC